MNAVLKTVKTIGQERYVDVIDEIKPLLIEHWLEIGTYREAISLDPDYERYRLMEMAGKLIILTAREDGKLIGYSIMFLLSHPHYKSTLFAMNDILFVQADKRGGSTGFRLIRASEEACKEHGATKISWHLKPSHDFSRALLKRGYAMDEINMAKLL